MRLGERAAEGRLATVLAGMNVRSQHVGRKHSRNRAKCKRLRLDQLRRWRGAGASEAAVGQAARPDRPYLVVGERRGKERGAVVEGAEHVGDVVHPL